jgi:tyrosine-protein kinase Etk/Wzc
MDTSLPTSPLNPAPESPSAISDLLTPTAILKGLSDSRLFLLRCAAVGVTIASVLAFLLPVSYTATATFIPPGAEYQSSLLGALSSQISSLGAASLLGGGSKGQGDLFIAILKSRSVADEIIQRFKLMNVYGTKKLSETEKKLASRSIFTIGSKDPLVTIEVTDHDPQRARDLANAYLQTVRSESQKLAVTDSAQRRLFFEQRLAKEKDALADAEVALKQMEEQTGLIAPAGQTMSQIQSRAQLQTQVTNHEVQLAALLHEETEDNPDIIRLRGELNSLRVQIAQLDKGGNRDTGPISTTKAPAIEMEYIRKQRDVKYHETLFEALAKQYETARLEEAKDAPLQVLDWATTPDTKSGPHRALIILLGLFIGLSAGVMRILLRDVRGTSAT